MSDYQTHPKPGTFTGYGSDTDEKGLRLTIERLTAELAAAKLEIHGHYDLEIERLRALIAAIEAREKALRLAVKRLTGALAEEKATRTDTEVAYGEALGWAAAAEAREEALREQVERLTALGDAMFDAVKRAWIFAPESLEMDEACEVWEMKGDKNE